MSPSEAPESGRTVLSDSFFFFSDFERLDRDLRLAGLLVESDDASVKLLTDREAFRTLLVAVARADPNA